jgi:hypothetical protein
MGLKGVGVGVDGAAIESGGIFKMVKIVGDVASVEEGARIGGVGGEPCVELGSGGFPVGFDDGGFGGGDLLRELAGGSGGLRLTRLVRGGLLFGSLGWGGR